MLHTITENAQESDLSRYVFDCTVCMLSGNIKFICTSFRNRTKTESLVIIVIKSVNCPLYISNVIHVPHFGILKS